MIKVNIKFGKLVSKNHNQLTALRIFTKLWCLYNAVDSSQYFVFERRLTNCLRLSCPLPVIGQLELM